MGVSDSMDSGIDRGRFLRATGLGLAAGALAAGGAAGAAVAAGGAAPARAAETPAGAMALLKAGNARFVAGTPNCGPLNARRVALEQGQSPFVAILSCSDSRVPIETVFDQEPGHIFGVRVAGNFVDDNGLGSIEYGVAVLGVRLILVLGHSSCGAVDATVKFVKNGTNQPSHIQGLLTAIEPAVTATKGKTGDWLANATAENVRLNVAAMTSGSPIVADAVKNGQLTIAGGVYHLDSGKVTFL